MNIEKKFLVIALLSSFLYGNDTVLQIQTQLIELGYNPGVVDGIMGKQTINSIRLYQEDMGLDVTGKANNKLLMHLNTSLESVDIPIVSNKPKSVRNNTKRKSFELPNLLSRNNTANTIFNYTYIEAGWGTTEAKVFDLISIDGNIINFLGSFDVAPNINLLAEYQMHSYDYDVEATVWSAGVGYHQKMQEKIDGIIAIKYYSANYTIPDLVNGDNSAFGFEAGVRYEVSDDFEVNGIISFINWDEGDADKSFIIGGRYDISNIAKFDNKITLGVKFIAGDSQGFGISLRSGF